MGSVIDLRDADNETLLAHMSKGAEIGSPMYEAAKNMLQVRNLNAQTQATQELVTSTREFVSDTKSLGRVTWMLFWVTVALAIETTILLFK